MSYLLGILLVSLLMLACGVVASEMQSRLRLVAVAYGALLGSGAYLYAICVTSGISPVVSLCFSLMVGGFSGAVLFSLSHRVVLDDFALTSFSLQIAWTAAISISRPLTGGVLGISRIDNVPFSNTLGVYSAPLAFAFLLVALAIGHSIVIERTQVSPALAIVAKSRQLSKTLGVPGLALRAMMGGACGGICACAGAVWAGHLSFIDPKLFGISLSVTILSIGIFGSVGRWGMVCGTVLLVAIPQLLRLANVSADRASSMQMALSGLCLLYGAAVILADGSRQTPGGDQC